MLAVASRKASHIEWREGTAEALPFEDASFDAVVSQFGLMFFPNKDDAISEMLRVLRPSGHLAVAVWDSLENTPGYAALTGLLSRLFGATAAESLVVPYAMGDTEVLSSTFASAGVPDVQIATLDGTARHPSIRAWMHVDIKGWTLADKLDDEQFESLVVEAEHDLARFVTSAGTVEFSSPAHIVTVTKTGVG